MKRALIVLACLVLWAAPARAQAPDELPPGHPQIAPDELPPGHPQIAPDELPPGHPQIAPDELPPGHPQVAPDELPPGHPHVAPGAGDPHGGMGGDTGEVSRAMQPPSVATGGESDEVPTGSIRVTVVDAAGTPQPEATVLLGIMRQGGDRERTPGITGADGVYTYTDLPTGTGQAYRINVPFEGATYSSTPFQLPPSRGYAVRVTRLPTTHDQRLLLLVVGQTFIEIHEERLHVVEEMQVSNLGEATYVFPDAGLRMELPEGWLAFQTQPVMTDQRLEEVADFGVALHGSLPPGRVTLAFAYDLPLSGSDMTFEVALPIRTYIYRVIADAPTTLRLDVDGMPRAIRFEDQGRSLLGTEIQRQPDDPQISHLRITMHGIPGPGPLRWIALAIAAVIVLGGVFVASRAGSRSGPVSAGALAERRRQLLEELRALDAEFESGEIGPAYRQSRRSAIVRTLAGVLSEEDRAANESSDSRPA